MHEVRFRDPAGYVRCGQWHDDSVSFAGDEYAIDDVDILAPVEPSKIVCVGLNYSSHAAEEDKDIPERPLLFLKGPNTVAAHGDDITLPSGKERIDFEAEIGVVISKQCKNVSADDAMDVVGGYTCVNDLSNRDDQRIEQNWIRGKAFDGAAPIGPVIADPANVPADARIQLRQNGEIRQDSKIDDLIFTIPELIEDITKYLTLEAGDVISTGTPAGVGPMADGDSVEVEIEGIGTLENAITIP